MPLIIMYQQVSVIYEHTLPQNSSNSAKTFIVLQMCAAIHVHVVVYALSTLEITTPDLFGN